MPFMQQDQPIQALTTDRADQPLAERARLRATHRRFQYSQPHCLNRAVDRRSIDAVAVVNEKSLRLITRDDRAELLHSPFGRGVRRHIPMHDPTRADFKDGKDVQRSKPRRHAHEEIAGELAPGWLRTKVLHRWDDTRSRGRPPFAR
jgi:hypothetical protein